MNLNRFIFKLLLILLVLLLLQCVFYLILPQEFPAIVNMLSKELQKENDIVGFGDSSVYFHAKEDDIDKSIFKILSGFYPQLSLHEFNSPAYHLDLYENMIRFFIAEHKNVKILIIPINMRSFSPQWNMNPGYQFEEENIAMKNYNNWIFRVFYKPLAVFKLFLPKIKDHDYNNAIVYNGDKAVGRVKEFLSRRYSDWKSEKYIKDKFIFHYMYSLGKEHRKISSMLRINKMAKLNNINVIFYVTPIDYESGNKAVGPEFQRRINDNVSVIKKIASKEGFDIIDLSLTLKASYFSWRTDLKGDFSPNEHLIDKGRLFVANKLKEKIDFIFDGGLH